MYCFPPIVLISRLLKKVEREKATVTLVAPLWRNQVWFPQLLRMLKNYPVLLPEQKHSNTPNKKSELVCESTDDVLRYIRRYLKDNNVPRGARYIICESWRDKTKKSYTTYIKQWVQFCIERDQSHGSNCKYIT